MILIVINGLYLHYISSINNNTLQLILNVELKEGMLIKIRSYNIVCLLEIKQYRYRLNASSCFIITDFKINGNGYSLT